MLGLWSACRAGSLLCLLFVGAQGADPTQSPTFPPAEIERCRELRLLGEEHADCGRKYYITNEAAVFEFWEVHEWMLYWDVECLYPLIPETIFSSGVRTTVPDNVPDLAFDGLTETKWSAQCIYALGGCLPQDNIHLGFWRDLQQDPIAVNQPEYLYAGIRCMKLFQSPNITRLAAAVNLMMSINDQEYEAIGEYTGLTGGQWQQRPSLAGAIWRLWNNEPTEAPWRVAELIFYYDHFCEEKIEPTPLSGTSNSYDPSGFFLPFECFNYGTCDTYSVMNAFDGVVGEGYELPEPMPTLWMANCDSENGCAKRDAWIGIDMGPEPRTINCLQIYQPYHDGYPEWGSPTYTSGLYLEVYNGVGGFSKWAEYEDFVPGFWNNTRPPYGYAWKLTSYDRMPQAWEVMEAAFYLNADCSPGLDPGLQGSAVDSNPALEESRQQEVCRGTSGSCADLAFDFQVATYWISSCGPCEQREAWIGTLFRRAYEDIRCFKVFQSGLYERQSSALELSMWIGQTWRSMRLELSVGGGTWNARPSAPGSMLRLLGTSGTLEPWIVSGVIFYYDDQCNDILELSDEFGPTALACGSAPFKSVMNAFTTDTDDTGGENTIWEASCLPPSRDSTGCAPSVAWLGMQTGTTGTSIVRCMRLRQGRRPANQMRTAVIQVWDGVRWIQKPGTEAFQELGGGAWQMFPGRRGSMWRLWMVPAANSVGVGVSELQLFSSTDCRWSSEVREAYPNKIAICSAFSTNQEIVSATGYDGHLQSMGAYGDASPDKAFDGDYGTFWAQIVQNSTWLGLDLTTTVMDVMCLRVSFAYLKTLQPSTVEVQGWDGKVWTTAALTDMWHKALRWDIPVPSMIGTQQRPMPAKQAWRLENGNTVANWEVIEIELHTLGDCSGEFLHGEAIASAQNTDYAVPAGGHRQPLDAFDGSFITSWSADCSQEGGCAPGEAWIGLQVLTGAVEVPCVRIAQSKQRGRQIEVLVVSAWMGNSWQHVSVYQGGGLGGEGWNQRPVGSDVMWRIVFKRRQEEECSTFLPAPFKRAWGVSELEFYADDECTIPLPGVSAGAVPITSGSRELLVSESTLESNPNAGRAYLSDNAFDGTIDTRWSAECPGGEEAPCEPGLEWIGLDFTRASGGLPVQVQCFKLHQSRYSALDCCDPADQVGLERWNGSSWVQAIWRHQPVEKDVVYVDGHFENLGPCPNSAEVLAHFGNDHELLWEEWQRRQTSECEIPVSGAVRLLSDQLCEKHPKCVEAGEVGLCCPVIVEDAISRCCCDFLIKELLFEDELDVGIDREPVPPTPVIGLEKLIIQSTTIMPFTGLVVGLLFWLVTLMPERHPDQRGFKVYIYFVVPALRWLNKIEPLSYTIAFLLQPVDEEKLWVTVLKRTLFVVFSLLMGACFIWTIGAICIAYCVLRVTSLIGLVLRVAKSPFDAKKKSEKKRLCIVLGIPFSSESAKRTINAGIGDLVAGIGTSFAVGMGYSVRCVFDVILMRFAAMNMGAVDVTLPVPELLAFIPELPFDFHEFREFLYEVTQVFMGLFQSFFTVSFSGVPRCQGPVLVITGMWLVAITLVLIRWLNYDYFGLFMVTKEVVKKTRPMFQKALMTGVVAGLQSAMFVAMQCVMLMFSRALTLVDIGNLFSESDQWQCPYEGEEMTIIVGKLFIVLASFMAVGVTFLCANGHFMGQDYITREFSGWVQMDLSGLDPDGVGDEGGIIRWDTVFSMLPTTFGIWMDSWNVHGFLITERATIYSSEMKYPEFCEICQVTHTPYWQVMRATSMQLSLAYQLVPFGAILGKACEYCNNPPLLYFGSRLKCYYHNKNIEIAKSGLETKPSKMPFGKKKVMYYVGLLVAVVKDVLVPTFVRAASVLQFTLLIVFTFMVNKSNMEELATNIFMGLFALSFLKALLELAIPVGIMIGLAAVMIMTKRQAKKVATGVDRKIKWLGQVLHGCLPGMVAASYLMRHPDWKYDVDTAAYIGVGIGMVTSWIALFLAGAQEAMPRTRILANMIQLAYNVTLAYFAVEYLVWDLERTRKWIVVIGLWVFLVPVTAVAFRPPPKKGHKDKPPSQIKPLLFSIYALPGLLGVAGGVFLTTQSLNLAIDLQGEYIGLGAAMGFGYIFALGFTFAAEKVLDKPAGRRALFIAIMVSIPIGVVFHFAIGTCVGSLCGSLYGAYMERKFQQKVRMQSWEEIDLKSSKKVVARQHTMDQPFAEGDSRASTARGLEKLRELQDAQETQDAGDAEGPLTEKEAQAIQRAAELSQELKSQSSSTGGGSTKRSDPDRNKEVVPEPPEFIVGSPGGTQASNAFREADATGRTNVLTITGGASTGEVVGSPSRQQQQQQQQQQHQMQQTLRLEGVGRKQKKFSMAKQLKEQRIPPGTPKTAWAIEASNTQASEALGTTQPFRPARS